MSNLKTVSFMLEEETKQWIDQQAAAQDRSASQVVRHIIRTYREYLDRPDETPAPPQGQPALRAA